MNFSTKIEAAKVAGLLAALGELMRDLGRSASWYEDKSDRIDQAVFDDLRRRIDEAEALWKASRQKIKLEAVK